MTVKLPHLHLNPENFTDSHVVFQLNHTLFSEASDGLICTGFIGEAEAGTFCDLHGDTQFLLTSEGRYWYGLEEFGQFQVGDHVRVCKRGDRLIVEPAPMPRLQDLVQ